MNLKDDDEDKPSKNTRGARRKAGMKDPSDDSKDKGGAKDGASNAETPAKGKPRKPARKKATPRKRAENSTPAPEQGFSFFIPFLDGMIPSQPPAPPRKRKRGPGNAIENPAEDNYDRAHSNYYLDLTAEEQAEIADLEKKVSDTRSGCGVPLRFRILRSGMNAKTKGLVLQKAESLLSGDPFNSEKPKLNKWIDTVLRIPFGIFKPPPVSRDSPVSEIRGYIRSTEEALHKNVYGHAEAKGQIIQTLAKWISNPSSKGNVLGIHGPPGVGKSTLVKHIGDALGTPTITIPLGGASDGSFLDGHSYVYEGSLPGIMVSSVSKTGCMNPVILLDELDKVSTSPKGAEIVNILIHLTDPVQNTAFRDKYLGDVELDLSQAVFVFTFNDINAIHPILKDRMLCIETKAYTFEDKLQIARRHLLPKICVEHGFEPDQFAVGEDALREIVSRVESESGVRNMNRALESIVSQVNFDRILGNFEVTPRINIVSKMIRDNIKPQQTSASVNHLYL